MTRDESLEIVAMILVHWRGQEWSKEEIDVYARLIQDMPAEVTTSTVIKAAKELAYRPSVSELRERVRVERRRLAAVEPPPPEPEGTPIPHWVKRWLCARLLYARFGQLKPDLRRFTEQGEWGDLTQELMPEGAWEKEVTTMNEQSFAEAFKRLAASTMR